MAGVKLILTVILALAGLFFLAAPHNVHLSLGLVADHSMHQIIGVVLLVVAAVVHMKMKK